MMRAVGKLWQRSGFFQHRDDCIDGVLEEACLPAIAGQLVRDVIRRARLSPSASRDIAEELAAHFLDGMECGRNVRELVADFGDRATTARLLRQAKLQQSPLAIRVARRGAMVLAGVLVVTMAAYFGSAASLYLSRPVQVVPAAGAAEELQELWRNTPPIVQLVSARSRDQLLDASQLGAVLGEPPGKPSLVQMLSAVFLDIDSLRATKTVSGDRLAAEIESDALSMIESALRLGILHSATPGWLPLSERLRHPARLDGLRTAFDQVLAFLYSNDGNGNGRLTVEGLEVVRVLKNWHEPTLTDRVLQPAWYVLPASRRSAFERFEMLVQLAELPEAQASTDLESALAPLRASVFECLRYPSLSAVLPELIEALRMHHAAELQRMALARDWSV